MSDLYVYEGQANCKSCEDSIHWFRTPAGKNLPVNDAPELPPLQVGMTFTRAEGKDQILPFNHFATCPQAGRHRRG